MQNSTRYLWMVLYNLKFNLRLSRKLAKKIFQKRTTKEQYKYVSKLENRPIMDFKYYAVAIMICLYFWFAWALKNLQKKIKELKSIQTFEFRLALICSELMCMTAWSCEQREAIWFSSTEHNFLVVRQWNCLVWCCQTMELFGLVLSDNGIVWFGVVRQCNCLVRCCHTM